MKNVVLLFFIFFAVACSSDLDFNQVNDLKVEPVLVINLSRFDLPAHDFVINGIEQSLTADVVSFNVFKDTDFNKSLSRVDFFFEINNTISRAYEIDIYFIDDNDLIVHTVSMNVPAYTGTQNMVSKTEVFENGQLEVLKNASNVVFVLAMSPGPALSETSLGSIKMKSSATVYLNIE